MFPAYFLVRERLARDVDRQDLIKVRRLGNPMGQKELLSPPKQQVVEVRSEGIRAKLFKMNHVHDMDRRGLGNDGSAFFKMASKQASLKRAQSGFIGTLRKQIHYREVLGLERV